MTATVLHRPAGSVLERPASAWQPMHTAPQDRPVLLMCSAHRIVGELDISGQWVTAEAGSRTPDTLYPGAWCELPALPGEG